jgi:hypothetical protein
MRMRIRPGDERGAYAVLMAILLVVLVGMLSLTVDGGLMWLKYRGIRTSNDAAALAAALSCAKKEGLNAANARADQFATANVADAAQLTPNAYSPSCDASSGSVTVRYGASQQLYFSRVVGFSSPREASSWATAKWGGAGGSADVSPLMLNMNRLGTCQIPPNPPPAPGTDLKCAFWWDNSPSYLGNAAWGLMNLDEWDVSPTQNCSNAGQASYKDWLLNGYRDPLVINDPPAPTYACRDSGFFGGALDNDIAKAIQRGVPYAFPVNDPSKQIDSNGNICLAPSCSPDKYYIIGFAWLKLVALYGWKDKGYSQYCGAFPADSNARCLLTQWVGFSTTGILGGGGQNFGLIAVALTG